MKKISVVKLLNYLGLNKFGSNGSLFLFSYFTNILKDVKKNNQIKTTGFNGKYVFFVRRSSFM